MDTINKHVVLVKPNERFMEWLYSVTDPKPVKFDLAELREQCSVYLIPDFENAASGYRFIYENYEGILEEELSAWYTDETLWPKNRDLQMFQSWFDIEIHDLVFDLVDESVEKDTE